MKKVLFISPPFHKYSEAISNAIKNNYGYEVDYIPECHYTFTFNSLKYLSKILLKIYVNRILFKRIKELFSEKNVEYDYFFVIRGEQISNNILEYVKKKNPRIKSIFYNWDSFKENPNSKDIFDFFDKSFSFDPIDCKENKKLKYKPLFYINNKEVNHINLKQEYDILFLGTDHSNRFEVVSKVNKFCKNNNLKFKCYLITSKISFFKKKIFRIEQYRKAVRNDFRFELVPYQEFLNSLIRSKAVLDVNNSIQDGLTMRTFETLGNGKKLITTNRNILKEEIYNPNNIALIDPTNIDISIDFFSSEFEESEVIEKYEINNWVKDFFDEI